MQLYHHPNRVPVTKAIVHCAAVPTGWLLGKTKAQAREYIKGWHKERGFKDIGYHYLVFPDGTILNGRPVSEVGAHTQGHNIGSLGILMIESRKIDKMRDLLDYFTEEQRLSVRSLLDLHQISSVHGHNEFANKLCPGFYVKADTFDPPKPSSAYPKPFRRIGDVLREWLR